MGINEGGIEMNKKLLSLALTNALFNAGNNYAYCPIPRIGKRHSYKKYDNKDANIEYYYDEKGNIRRRKRKWWLKEK